MTEVLQAVLDRFRKQPNTDIAWKLLAAITHTLPDKTAIHANKELLSFVANRGRVVSDAGELESLRDLRHKSLLAVSPHCFSSYMQFLELKRPPDRRFFIPRIKVLKPIADEMQKLVDGELDELFVSLPPRVGKTSLLMFFVSWLIGRNSGSSNLYSAYSNIITSAFYDGVLEIITDPDTYAWNDVFPKAKIVSTDAKDNTLNIDRKKRYPSITCRSLYGTLNGACDCDGILLMDDLIGSIEEALSKDRLISAWTKVDNNLLPRAKQSAKYMWVGTRWAEIDPMGLRIDLITNDDKFANWRHKIINVPALNKNDESNFDYPYAVGFTTEYYQQRRASFERNNDLASWNAQYCGEPHEREGALFTPDDFTTFNGVLPEVEPTRVFMSVDPSWGGGDFCAAGIFYEFENEGIYLVDVVYNNGEKGVTRPLIIEKIKTYNVQSALFECTKTTSDYKDYIEDGLKDEGYRLNVMGKPAPRNKAGKIGRIFDRANEIREFIILENGKRSKEYQLFMHNVFSFKIVGKNDNDDAPDCLAIAVEMVRGMTMNKVSFFARPF